MLKISFITLGCKTNQYETQAMELICADKGLEVVPAGEFADIFVINSCAVTSSAGTKSRHEMRRVKKLNPSAVVAACGCYSKLEGEALVKSGICDIAGGNRDHTAFIESLISAVPVLETQIIPDNDNSKFEILPAGSYGGRTRALLKIEDGCDNFCAYCIIPYLRGRVRSVDPSYAVNEAARLSAEGYAEIVLTGIEIASYGRDLDPKVGLSELIVKVSNAAPDSRIRLGSLEPRLITPDFCSEISGITNLCRHFHLSLQSGCDETLKRMGRKYDTALFASAIEKLRKAFPGCAVTTDIICGFPGESDEEFEKTLNFCRSCRFDRVHIFPFSPRSGTKAVGLPGQIPKNIRDERARRLSSSLSKIISSVLGERIGETAMVLFESENDGLSSGYTGNYHTVYVKGTGLHSKLLPVRLTGLYSDGYSGEITDI